MALPEALLKDVNRAVKVFYINRATVKYWNRQRKQGDPVVFCGWYWFKGEVEGGPFNTQSACRRDAWYHVVLRMKPPVLNTSRTKAEHEAAKINGAAKWTPPKRRTAHAEARA